MMEEERLKKLRAGQEMFAEKRKRLKRRSQLKTSANEGSSPASDDLRGAESGSSVSQRLSSDSISTNSRGSSNTSQSSMASSASSDHCRKIIQSVLHESLKNGTDVSLNNSYSNTEVIVPPEQNAREPVLSPRHVDTTLNESLKKKMEEVQRQLTKKDNLIRQLSDWLKEAQQRLRDTEQDATLQEQVFAHEISDLKVKLQKCQELLKGNSSASAFERQLASLQETLHLRESLLAQLEQKVEAQDQQIAVLQDIRADLLNRLAAATVKPSQSIFTANGKHSHLAEPP